MCAERTYRHEPVREGLRDVGVWHDWMQQDVQIPAVLPCAVQVLRVVQKLLLIFEQSSQIVISHKFIEKRLHT